MDTWKRTRHLVTLVAACGIVCMTAALATKAAEPEGLTYSVVFLGYVGDADDLQFPTAINDNGAIVGILTPVGEPYKVRGKTYYDLGPDTAFLLEPVARRCLYLADIRETDSYSDLMAAIESYRERLSRENRIRPTASIPV